MGRKQTLVCAISLTRNTGFKGHFLWGPYYYRSTPPLPNRGPVSGAQGLLHCWDVRSVSSSSEGSGVTRSAWRNRLIICGFVNLSAHLDFRGVSCAESPLCTRLRSCLRLAEIRYHLDSPPICNSCSECFA